MCNVTFKHTVVKKQEPLTARSSSLRCVSAAEHHTAEQYSQTGRRKLRLHLYREAIYHGILARTSIKIQLSLRSCSENRVKMLLKSHRGIKCHFKCIEVIALNFGLSIILKQFSLKIRNPASYKIYTGITLAIIVTNIRIYLFISSS